MSNVKINQCLPHIFARAFFLDFVSDVIHHINFTGLTFHTKWNSDNKLDVDLKIKDQLLKGLMTGVDVSLVPLTG